MKKPLTVLAWDTATNSLATALVRFQGLAGEGEPVVLAEGVEAGTASQSLPPRLACMLENQGLAPTDIDLLVVGRGPGSFTGLRTGLALAQGLALGTGRPVLGLSTLTVLAFQILAAVPEPEALAAPVIDARHGEVFTALYSRPASSSSGCLIPQALVEPGPYHPAALPGVLAAAAGNRPMIVDGPGRSLVEASLGGPLKLGSGPDLAVSAVALAGLGAAVFQADPGAAPCLHPPLPLYIREPDLRRAEPFRPPGIEPKPHFEAAN